MNAYGPLVARMLVGSALMLALLVVLLLTRERCSCCLEVSVVMHEYDFAEEVQAIVSELLRLHEVARHLIGAPDARLEICNRIEVLAERVRRLDGTPR